MSVQVLPLAITMMAGPQIMSAIVLVTTGRAVRNSLGFLVGVLAATVVGVAIMRTVADLLGGTVPPARQASAGPSVGTVIQALLVVLLVALALKNYIQRKTVAPPKWLGTLRDAVPATALRTGFLVILLMPSDLVVMLTVGVHLEQEDLGIGAAAPFLGLTVLVAALPLLAFLLFRRRAEAAMPRVGAWMDTHSWLINVIACVIFIALIVLGD